MKSLLLKISNLLIFALFLSACGGGGDGSSPTTTPTVKSGVLVDAPIEGVSYQSTSNSGLTDATGTYQYTDGEVITFSIGNLILGSINQGKGVVTPLDLGNSQTAINIARFLQSIDVDADPNNGITITPSMQTALADLSVSLDFNQASVDFSADTVLATVLGLIAPTTLSGTADLRTEQDTITHLSVELNLGLIAAEVEGDYRVTFVDQPTSMIDYSFSSFLNGSVIENSVVENLTWRLTAQQLEVTIAGRGGLPQRFTLIEGTFLDGVLTAEIDQDQDGIYDRSTLATIIEVIKNQPGNSVALCGKQYDTGNSDKLSQHALQFPINQQWNYQGYNGYLDDEYLTFTNVVYQGVPAIRIDNYYTADNALIESIWYALATDSAIYELHSTIDGINYPCTSPNLRFPAILSTGLDWQVEVGGLIGTGTVVSLNTTSPAGYTNTILIRQIFNIGGSIVNIDNYYRTGEGLLDLTDNFSYSLQRIGVTPENSPANGGNIGRLSISASLSQDAGVFTITDSINVANSTISWTGDGITVVISTLLGTVSMQGTTGVVYACACLPQLDLTNKTITFNNAALNDAFPSQAGPTDNTVVINGTLTIPDPA